MQTLHTILPKLFLARRDLQGAEKELLAIRLYIALAYAYFFDRGKVPCLWAHLRAINLAERYPPTLELGHAWATHAPVMSLIPWLRRGEVYREKVTRNPQGIGRCLRTGTIASLSGESCSSPGRGLTSASAHVGKRSDLLERTGDFWERNMARWQSANAVFRKGDLARAITEAQELYEACVEMGDDKVSGFALDVWSRASGGQLPADDRPARNAKGTERCLGNRTGLAGRSRAVGRAGRIGRGGRRF